MSPNFAFKNRLHAGKQLAQALKAYTRCPGGIVLALPRGGVPVGYSVAAELDLDFDILLVKKLGLPGYEEFAMGAVGDGGIRVVNGLAIREHHISPNVIYAACARAQREIAIKERKYRRSRPRPHLRGRTVILVDDGLATGSTMRAAVCVAQSHHAANIVVAVPVGAPDSCNRLAAEVDELICLKIPFAFGAVSEWYQQFEQVGDDEVKDLLSLAWQEKLPPETAEEDVRNLPERSEK